MNNNPKDWIGRRCLRVDKHGKRMAGLYVLNECWPQRGLGDFAGPGEYYYRLRRASGSKDAKPGTFSRTRIRIEGVDPDFDALLAAPVASEVETLRRERDEAVVVLRDLYAIVRDMVNLIIPPRGNPGLQSGEESG